MNTTEVFIHQIKIIFEEIPEEKRQSFKKNIEKWLLRTFTLDISEKAERFINIGRFGPLPLIEDSVRLMHEVFQCYVNGLFHSTVTLCGVTAERICFDIIEANKEYSNLSEIFHYVNFNNLIDILYKYKLIKEQTKDNLHKIRRLRNHYVHIKEVEKLNPIKDAEKALNIILEIFKTEIGPSPNAIYSISKDGLRKKGS